MRLQKLAKRLLIVTVATALTASGMPAWSVEWNHDPASAVGPQHWGDLDPTFATCAEGMRQSPIDIAAVDRAGPRPELKFRYRAVPLVVENNGHTLEVPITSDNELRIGNDRYRLLQFHFHTPSEHTIGGESLVMEAHLVHIDSNNQLAVVGVMMVAGEANATVAAALDNAPATEGEVHVQGVAVDPAGLLPASAAYYAYPGSLTTPPCSEGVRWFVLREPITVSPEQVQKLADFIRLFPAYEGFDTNNRPVQPLNDRSVQESRRGG